MITKTINIPKPRPPLPSARDTVGRFNLLGFGCPENTSNPTIRIVPATDLLPPLQIFSDTLGTESIMSRP